MKACQQKRKREERKGEVIGAVWATPFWAEHRLCTCNFLLMGPCLGDTILCEESGLERHQAVSPPNVSPPLAEAVLTH